MRWSSHSDGYACFSDHTVGRFRGGLKRRFGTLEELNQATLRHYVDWEDVLPAKSQARNNTEMVLWQQFITDRTAEDLRWRHEQVRAGDPPPSDLCRWGVPTTFSTGAFLDNNMRLAAATIGSSRGRSTAMAARIFRHGFIPDRPSTERG